MTVTAGAVFCYGMLLDPEGWLRDAGLIGPGVVWGRMLDLSRGLADCPECEDGVLHGAAWRADDMTLASLDRVEGVAGGLYRRALCTVELRSGGTVDAVLYERTPRESVYDVLSQYRLHGPPWKDVYVEAIARGYRRFGLPEAALRSRNSSPPIIA